MSIVHFICTLVIGLCMGTLMGDAHNRKDSKMFAVAIIMAILWVLTLFTH